MMDIYKGRRVSLDSQEIQSVMILTRADIVDSLPNSNDSVIHTVERRDCYFQTETKGNI